MLQLSQSELSPVGTQTHTYAHSHSCSDIIAEACGMTQLLRLHDCTGPNTEPWGAPFPASRCPGRNHRNQYVCLHTPHTLEMWHASSSTSHAGTSEGIFRDDVIQIHTFSHTPFSVYTHIFCSCILTHSQAFWGLPPSHLHLHEGAPVEAAGSGWQGTPQAASLRHGSCPPLFGSSTPGVH